jgi:hypothetical protein
MAHPRPELGSKANPDFKPGLKASLSINPCLPAPVPTEGGTERLSIPQAPVLSLVEGSGRGVEWVDF